MRKRKREAAPGPLKVDLTPLIDCVFLLIVFFIVAGKFKKVESKLNAYLPKDSGIHPSAPQDPDRFFISVLCQYEDNQVSWTVNNKPVKSRSELVERIREISAATEGKDIKLSIDGNAEVDFLWIIASIDAAVEAELTEIILSPPRVPLSNWPRPRPKNIPISFYSR
ncbi:MAG: biopolymer transporter ExbD [Planctomycetota bacterium]|nr:biopolymer transporter ExbD [Planctomycetota bacterium]